MSRDWRKTVRSAGAGWGAARALLGVMAITRPPSVSRPWIGEDAYTTGGTVFAKALGARDVALGAGTAVAALSGRGFPLWALASAAADVGDTLATRQHWHELPRTRLFIAALAGGSAVAGTALAVADAAGALSGRCRETRSGETAAE
ncbi:MAG: hypothetical protein HOV66_19135 [Streptomycetaceae bacterium]|jgi:hypothetical protein|nr:hypothetical protein [Streptomycetaceae bacterium]NUS56948.1 hypothetical protein [Streptomycetaceae bacterium]